MGALFAVGRWTSGSTAQHQPASVPSGGDITSVIDLFDADSMLVSHQCSLRENKRRLHGVPKAQRAHVPFRYTIASPVCSLKFTK